MATNLPKTQLLHEYLAEQVTTVNASLSAKASAEDVPTVISDLITPQSHIADASGTLEDITAKFNTLLLALETVGILNGE